MHFQRPCFLGNKFKKRENGKDTRVDLAKAFINRSFYAPHPCFFLQHLVSFRVRLAKEFTTKYKVRDQIFKRNP